MVKFQLEAVAVRRGIVGNGRKAGISFRPDSYIVKSLSVDFHVTGIIFLLHGVFQHLIPVVRIHENIYLHDLIRV